MALLLATLNVYFRGSEEVEEKLNLPVLGIVPSLRRQNRAAMVRMFTQGDNHTFAEAVRTIRTGVLLSGVDRPQKRILVTSSVPGEGKSTLAANLAFGVGQMERVLLIEADMRRPALARSLDFAPGTPGLANLIVGTASADEAISSLDGIDVLCAGQVPPNPLELLSTERFATILQQLEQDYDRLIIDSPPVQAVSDALILATHSHAVLYVLDVQKTARALAIKGVGQLLQARAPLVGVVMNQVDIKKAKRQGYHYGAYYDYYGYSDTSTTAKSSSAAPQAKKGKGWGRRAAAEDGASAVQVMLQQEASRLSTQQSRAQRDALTGAANREHFLNLLDSVLLDTETTAHHGLFLIRVSHLTLVRQRLGHKRTDALLVELTQGVRQVLDQLPLEYAEYHLGRLNGSDFALLLRNAHDLSALETALQSRLQALTQALQDEAEVLLPFAGVRFLAGQSRPELIMRLDSLLASAEKTEKTVGVLDQSLMDETPFLSAEAWRQALIEALEQHQLSIAFYPVLDRDGGVLHQEAVMRLSLGGTLRSAGFFLPWARRLGLLPRLDLAMLELALRQLAEEPDTTHYAINLSVETLQDVAARRQLMKLLRQDSALTQRLWLEFPEYAVRRQFGIFRDFATDSRGMGYKLGLEKAGEGLAKPSWYLQDLHLDYIKIDGAYVRDITQADSRNFLQGLRKLSRALGVLLVAEGVESQDKMQQLIDLGLDGVTGPGVISPPDTTDAKT